MAVALTLVHSPLVGPATWDVLAAALSGRGREAWIPDLTRSVSDGPPYLAVQVESIVEVVDGRPTILVGHSGAGPLLAAMGQSLGCVEGYVFVDAGLPHPGLSWFDSAPPELAELRDAPEPDGGNKFRAPSRVATAPVPIRWSRYRFSSGSHDPVVVGTNREDGVQDCQREAIGIATARRCPRLRRSQVAV